MENNMIINPIEEILENIPELSEITDTYSNREFVSYKNWDNRMKSISTKNLHKYKKAMRGVDTYFNPCIISIHSDDEVVEFNKDKYTLIRKYVMSEEHHK